jgi:hypothetical protein
LAAGEMGFSHLLYETYANFSEMEKLDDLLEINAHLVYPPL